MKFRLLVLTVIIISTYMPNSYTMTQEEVDDIFWNLVGYHRKRIEVQEEAASHLNELLKKTSNIQPPQINTELNTSMAELKKELTLLDKTLNPEDSEHKKTLLNVIQEETKSERELNAKRKMEYVLRVDTSDAMKTNDDKK